MNIETFENTCIKNKKNNIESKIFAYSSVVGFLLIILMVIMNVVEKNLYYQNSLIIINDEMALLNVLPQDLNIIQQNHYLFVNNKKYYYSLQEIELINENSIYYQVMLKMDNNLLVNSINSCKILIRKEKIFNYIVRIIKGG